MSAWFWIAWAILSVANAALLFVSTRALKQAIYLNEKARLRLKRHMEINLQQPEAGAAVVGRSVQRALDAYRRNGGQP